MRFRTKYVPQIGYFGQVKTGLFSRWKVIGKHVHGYGLYPEDHIDHPLETEHKAIERCKLYEQWKVLSEGVAIYGSV